MKSCEAPCTSVHQSQLNLIAGMHRAPKDAPAQIVRQIDSVGQAVAVSMKLCGGKLAYIAACLGISTTYVSMIRNGHRPMPAKLVDQFCIVTGTRLLRQYLDLHAALTDCPDMRISRLADELRRAA